MNTSGANIRCESGTQVRTSRGRRRPVYRTAPALATCPACGFGESADAIAAGRCWGCARAAKIAARAAR